MVEMKIAVVGLGLIGGSFAKAFSEQKNVTLYCLDRDETTIARARLERAMDDVLTKDNIGECDYIFVALYPKATEEFLREYAPFISKNSTPLPPLKQRKKRYQPGICGLR